MQEEGCALIPCAAAVKKPASFGIALFPLGGDLKQSCSVKFNREMGKEQGPFSWKLLHLWLCALTGEHKQQGVRVGIRPCLTYVFIPSPPP